MENKRKHGYKDSSVMIGKIVYEIRISDEGGQFETIGDLVRIMRRANVVGKVDILSLFHNDDDYWHIYVLCDSMETAKAINSACGEDDKNLKYNIIDVHKTWPQGFPGIETKSITNALIPFVKDDDYGNR